MRTLNKIFKLDKEKFKIPRCVQDIIPIKAIWEDGIFQVSKNKFSKSFKFMDINYAVASKEDKEAMFLDYSDLLNSLDVGAITKITINNRRINKLDFEKTILLDESNDELNDYRKEYNKMLISQAKNANEIVQEKIITISVYKKNVEEARNYFNRAGSELISRFNTLGSKCVELDAKERLRIAHDFYRTGEETSFRFDIHETMKKGHNFKDFICPDTVELERDYFKMGDRYGRVLFLKEYSSYINDDMVTELTDLNKNMMLSIDVIPIPMDEAVKEAENRRLGVETNITNWQRKQNAQNNYSAIIPYDMEQQRNDSKEMLDDLTIRDQRMFLGVITMVITEESKEKLESVTDAILKIASKNLCQLGILRFQQLDGLNTVLPFGVRKIDAVRTLTTESLAVFMPFKVQEIRHKDGIFYGQNAISKNMIIADRRQLLNGNSFILGVSGSGKSFTAKQEILSIRLRDPNADIIIIDPEREYAPLVKSFNGEVIKISATSDNHINAMDMNSEYGDGANPVILKSEFILSLCELIVGGKEGLQPVQKTIIDRCVRLVYQDYLNDPRPENMPILEDLYNLLRAQDEKEAQYIATALEIYVTGSLNVFNHQSNVDINNRIVCYVEPRIHQPCCPQIHPLLHRRDAPAAERGTDRRLHGGDLEAVQKMGRHPHRHHAECQRLAFFPRGGEHL